MEPAEERVVAGQFQRGPRAAQQQGAGVAAAADRAADSRHVGRGVGIIENPEDAIAAAVEIDAVGQRDDVVGRRAAQHQVLAAEAGLAVAPSERRAVFEGHRQRAPDGRETAALVVPLDLIRPGADVARQRAGAGQHGRLVGVVGVQTKIARGQSGHLGHDQRAVVDPRRSQVRVVAVEHDRLVLGTDGQAGRTA